MKAYLVSDNIDTVTGMRLSGIEGEVVHEKEELVEAIDRVLKDKSVGILFVTELLGTRYPDIISKAKLENKQPLILEIPDRHGSRKRVDFITPGKNTGVHCHFLLQGIFQTQGTNPKLLLGRQILYH